MSDPCTCHLCVVAGCDRPPVTIPAFRSEPARTLHGVDLVRHYQAQDELKAVLARYRGTVIERALSKVLKA